MQILAVFLSTDVLLFWENKLRLFSDNLVYSCLLYTSPSPRD